MNKKKIAFIGQRGVPPTYGGIERYVDEIVQRLPSEEVESFTYCRRHYVEKIGVPYTKQLFVPSMESVGFEAFSHSFISSIDALRYPFDLIHYQALGPSLFSCIPKIKGTKIVATVHGLDWQRAKWGRTGKFVLKRGEWMMGKTASAVISVSKRLARYYEDKFKKEVFFVPIGFSQPKILEVNEIERRFNVQPFKYILFLNRIVPEKGAHYLIEAFKRVKRDDFKLVIAGNVDQGDKYIDNLKQMANDDKDIIFTGYVTQDEVHELYSNAYLFALPSELEGMPAVVLEAMSHRCPVLVSDIEECVDIVKGEDRTYGYIHKNRDVDDLEKRLRYLLEHPEEVEGLRVPSFEYVSKEFSWDKATKMTYDVYKHVLDGS